MQQDLQELLKTNLKDIQLPTEVGLFPLAPGWWLVAVSLLIAVMIAAIKYRRHRAENDYRRIALSALNNAYAHWQEDQNCDQYIHIASGLMRRCILHAQGDENLTSATGESWAEVLNRLAREQLKRSTLNALTKQCYQRAPNIDVDTVQDDLVSWIKSHRRAKSIRKTSGNSVEAKNV